MKQQQLLEHTLQGLEQMINKYKLNQNAGDRDRLDATKQAHSALRKVMLMCEITGEFNEITPVKQGKKHGWMIIDKNMKTKYYC